MSKVRDAFVREDTSVSPNAEDIYEDYFELSERVSKVRMIYGMRLPKQILQELESKGALSLHDFR